MSAFSSIGRGARGARSKWAVVCLEHTPYDPAVHLNSNVFLPRVLHCYGVNVWLAAQQSINIRTDSGQTVKVRPPSSDVSTGAPPLDANDFSATGSSLPIGVAASFASNSFPTSGMAHTSPIDDDVEMGWTEDDDMVPEELITAVTAAAETFSAASAGARAADEYADEFVPVEEQRGQWAASDGNESDDDDIEEISDEVPSSVASNSILDDGCGRVSVSFRRSDLTVLRRSLQASEHSASENATTCWPNATHYIPFGGSMYSSTIAEETSLPGTGASLAHPMSVGSSAAAAAAAAAAASDSDMATATACAQVLRAIAVPLPPTAGGVDLGAHPVPAPPMAGQVTSNATSADTYSGSGSAAGPDQTVLMAVQALDRNKRKYLLSLLTQLEMGDVDQVDPRVWSSLQARILIFFSPLGLVVFCLSCCCDCCRWWRWWWWWKCGVLMTLLMCL